MESTEDSSNDISSRKLRRIRTARSLRAINSGARQGFFPLLRQLKPSAELKEHYCLVRNSRTGEVVSVQDPGLEIYQSPSWETVLEGSYYPYQYKTPFAAYLIPKDILAGEEVYLLDLIEDYAGLKGPAGETYRLESCNAIWTGNDLEIQYDPNSDMQILA